MSVPIWKSAGSASTASISKETKDSVDEQRSGMKWGGWGDNWMARQSALDGIIGAVDMWRGWIRWKVRLFWVARARLIR
eukprot:scaffold51787_cov30-Tisochrysis_lutea.AAC.5